MRILVTGSSGTIGVALCKRLLEKGNEVVGLDVKKNPWSKQVADLTLVRDLRDARAFEGLGSFDALFHLAANALVYPLVVEPRRALDNITMAFNALEFARAKKIPRFFFASSREVYGNIGRPKKKESDIVLSACESPYAASKMAGEALTHSYHECYGTDFIIFRFSNVYGRYDESNRVVPQFIRRALKGEDMTVFGKDKSLSFTFIDDAVDGVVACLKRFNKAKNKTLNIAGSKSQRILALAQTVKKQLNSHSRIVIKPARTGEVIRYEADISQARKLLGFNPKTSLEEGVRRTIAWHRSLERKG